MPDDLDDRIQFYPALPVWGMRWPGPSTLAYYCVREDPYDGKPKYLYRAKCPYPIEEQRPSRYFGFRY